MGDLPTEQPVLPVNKGQDEERRKLAGEQEGQQG
jgi:hypothetical protein